MPLRDIYFSQTGYRSGNENTVKMAAWGIPLCNVTSIAGDVKFTGGLVRHKSVDGKFCLQNRIERVDLPVSFHYCIHFDSDNG